MADWLSPEQRSRNMSAIRSSGTKPEVALGRAIREAFPRRRIVRAAALKGRPDYYLPGLRLAVFADGCFWHGCRVHGRNPSDNATYWSPKICGNRRRDRLTSAALRASGVTVIRVWEHDLGRDTNAVIVRLRRAAARAAARRAARANSACSNTRSIRRRFSKPPADLLGGVCNTPPRPWIQGR